jgi:hypothetical protein
MVAMSFHRESFTACEWLIKKHSPLLLRIGPPLEEEKPEREGVTGRRPIDSKLVDRMRSLRSCGMTIPQIARQCGVSLRSVWKYSR